MGLQRSIGIELEEDETEVATEENGKQNDIILNSSLIDQDEVDV